MLMMRKLQLVNKLKEIPIERAQRLKTQVLILMNTIKLRMILIVINSNLRIEMLKFLHLEAIIARSLNLNLPNLRNKQHSKAVKVVILNLLLNKLKKALISQVVYQKFKINPCRMLAQEEVVIEVISNNIWRPILQVKIM